MERNQATRLGRGAINQSEPNGVACREGGQKEAKWVVGGWGKNRWAAAQWEEKEGLVGRRA